MKKKTKTNRTLLISQAAVIAALYVALTLISSVLGIGNGVIQVRLSEALTVLPLFTPAAIWGLFVGCLLGNVITGCAIWDIIFGSLATLIGALGTYYLRKRIPLAIACPIISNTLIIPPVLAAVYGVKESIGFLMLTVGIGEILSCAVLGLILYNGIKKRNIFK